jgi:hypothetical protein
MPLPEIRVMADFVGQRGEQKLQIDAAAGSIPSCADGGGNNRCRKRGLGRCGRGKAALERLHAVAEPVDE